jgi:hypothetical protein
VRSRLDDDQLVAVDERVAGLGQAGEQRGDDAGGGVVAPDRPVVRVADGDRAVRQDRHTERVLQERLPGRAVDVTEVEEPGADDGGHLARVDTAQ